MPRNQPSVPAKRAFVVQVHAETQVEQRQWKERVEHLDGTSSVIRLTVDNPSQGSLPLMLLFFNVGVELGLLLLITAVLLLVALDLHVEDAARLWNAPRQRRFSLQAQEEHEGFLPYDAEIHSGAIAPHSKMQSEVYEKFYDVAWGDADKRQPNANGKLPPVGNTVDVANAT